MGLLTYLLNVCLKVFQLKSILFLRTKAKILLKAIFLILNDLGKILKTLKKNHPKVA